MPSVRNTASDIATISGWRVILHLGLFAAVVIALPRCGPMSADLTPYAQTGMASSYSNQHHGLPTTSGEAYNRHAYTAAHATLPLGTIVWVKNLETGREVKVRINDRKRSTGTSILCLSSKAALNLGMTASTAAVRISVLRETEQMQASADP